MDTLCRQRINFVVKRDNNLNMFSLTIFLFYFISQFLSKQLITINNWLWHAGKNGQPCLWLWILQLKYLTFQNNFMTSILSTSLTELTEPQRCWSAASLNQLSCGPVTSWAAHLSLLLWRAENKCNFHASLKLLEVGDTLHLRSMSQMAATNSLLSDITQTQKWNGVIGD